MSVFWFSHHSHMGVRVRGTPNCLRTKHAFKRLSNDYLLSAGTNGGLVPDPGQLEDPGPAVALTGASICGLEPDVV